MLRAYDTWHIRHDIDLVCVPVAGSPRTDSTPLVIADGLFATFPATALLPFGRMHHDGDGSIRTDSYVIDNSMLDIQDDFEYLFGEHTFPFCTAFFLSRKIVQENVCFFNVCQEYDVFATHTF